MAGLFFCLASDTVQGFYFCPITYQPRASVYSSFSDINAITAKTPKPFIWLYRGISVDLTHSNIRNTTDTQADYTPTAPRWRAYHQAQQLHRYQITPTHRTLCKPAQPPIIIMYIRVQGSARRLAIWHRVSPAPSTRRGSPAARSRRAEPLAACRRTSFRAFAR